MERSKQRIELPRKKNMSAKPWRALGSLDHQVKLQADFSLEAGLRDLSVACFTVEETTCMTRENAFLEQSSTSFISFNMLQSIFDVQAEKSFLGS